MVLAVQVLPAAQVVPPVQVLPPHCPYFGTTTPVPAVLVPVGVTLVTVTVAGFPPTKATPEPPCPDHTAGPGTV